MREARYLNRVGRPIWAEFGPRRADSLKNVWSDCLALGKIFVMATDIEEDFTSQDFEKYIKIARDEHERRHPSVQIDESLFRKLAMQKYKNLSYDDKVWFRDNYKDNSPDSSRGVGIKVKTPVKIAEKSACSQKFSSMEDASPFLRFSHEKRDELISENANMTVSRSTRSLLSKKLFSKHLDYVIKFSFLKKQLSYLTDCVYAHTRIIYSKQQ